MSNKIIESKYYNRSIYQARPLIEACKQFDLNEGRLFYLGLLELKPQLSEGNGQAEFEKIVIPTADVIKLFGGNASYYTKLRPIARKLRGRGITVREGDESFHDISIFRNMQFDKKLGGLVIHFNEDMRPYILELQGKPYTKVAAKTIFSLSSMYAIRLMELMLDYQNIPAFRNSHVIRRSIDVAELRFYCGIGDAKYRKITDFTKNVVQRPCAEINASTPYRIGFEVVREGRNIKGYSFVMRLPANEDEVDTVEQIVEIKQTEKLKKARMAGKLIDSTNADLYELLIVHGVGKIIARRLVKRYDRSRIVDNIRYASENSRARNLGAYIRNAIEGDYAAVAERQPSLFEVPVSTRAYSTCREQLVQLGISEMYAGLMVDSVGKHQKFSFSERSVCEALGLDADAVYAAIQASDFSSLPGRSARAGRAAETTAGTDEFTEDDGDDMLFLLEREAEGKLTPVLMEKLRFLRAKYRQSKKQADSPLDCHYSL